MRLYLAVTADQLELPLFVTDSLKEIAERFGTTTGNVASSIKHGSSGRYKGYKFVRVDVEDES